MGTSPTETPKPGGDAGTHDRRVTSRRNVVDSHLVTVDLAFQSGALLLDLSETGMGVQALSSAPQGVATSLQFDLPETGGRVDAMGRIAWTDSSGRLGIRFEEIAELSRVHLAQWLSLDRRPVLTPGLNVAGPTWPVPYARDEISALRRDLITEKLEGDAALAFVVERVRNVTRATGAAIALEDGGFIMCRASSGNAPGIGARLEPNAGLSGECIRTSEIVRCEDTESDPRADRLICRKLELRSMVIVPVRVQGRPAGVLEAFSSRAHAFQSSDVLLLRRIADLVAGIAVREPETIAPSITGPQALMVAATLEPLMVEPSEPPKTPLMIEDIFTVEELMAPLPPPPMVTRPPTPPRPEKEFAASPSLPQPRAEIVEKATPAAAPVPRPPVAPTAALSISPEVAASPAVGIPATRSSAAPRDMATPSPAPTAAMRAMGAAAMAATAAIRHRPVPVELEENDAADTLGAAAMSDAMLANMPVQVAPPSRLRLTGAGILAAVLIVGGWQVWRAIAPPPGTPLDSEIKQTRPVANKPSPPLSGSSTPTASGSSTPTAPGSSTPTAALPSTTLPVTVVPVAKTTVAAVYAKAANPPATAKSAAARPVPTPATREWTTAPVVAEVGKAGVPEAPPTVGLERPGAPAISSVLAGPVAPPRLDRAVISELSGGKLVKRYEPVYPSSAAGVIGEVVLKATINKEGKVSQVKVVSGHPMLAQSAVAAVRRWTYDPYRLNGVPIEIETTVVVNFKAR